MNKSWASLWKLVRAVIIGESLRVRARVLSLPFQAPITNPIVMACCYSHIVSIPPGPHLLSDLIASSPILAADGGAFAASAAAGASGDGDIDMAALGGGGGAGGAGGDDFGGIDPSMDPELAMVRVQVVCRFLIGHRVC
jgi:hypothetical protein